LCSAFTQPRIAPPAWNEKEETMGRTARFDELARIMRIAHFCARRDISSAEGLERAAELDRRYADMRLTRRELLANAGKLAGVGAAVSLSSPLTRGAFAAPSAPNVSVGIVGAGLAGLVCADQLKASGISASV
jgi:monoamine oxidase